MKNIVASARGVLAGRSTTAATLQTVLARVLILAVNTGTGIITARVLGPGGRGEQEAIGLWPYFLAYLMTLGIPVALRYNLKRYPDKESELFSAALVLDSVMGIVAALIGILIMPQLLRQYSPQAIEFAQWFMLVSPLILVTTVFIAALEADYDFTTANQAQYLSPLMTLVILGGLALTHTLTPFTAVVAYAFPYVPVFFWLLLRLWKRYRPRWYGLDSSYKSLISYGIRAHGIDILGTLALYVDKALVVNLLPPKEMGLYVVSLSLSRMLNLFQQSIVTVLLPKAAARPTTEVIALTGLAVRISTALTTFAAVAVITIVPFLLRLLYGTKFIAAVPVFRILVVVAVVDGTTWILAQAFMALGRPGTVTLLQGVGLGLSFPLLLLLIPMFGLKGAGLALLGSTIVRFIFVLLSYPLILKVRPPSLLITREDLYLLRQKFQSLTN